MYHQPQLYPLNTRKATPRPTLEILSAIPKPVFGITMKPKP